MWRLCEALRLSRGFALILLECAWGMMSDRPRGDALIHLLPWFRLLQQVVLALPMNVSVPRRRDATVRIREMRLTAQGRNAPIK